MPPTPREPGIYHERQVAQMCALHALNNLYQRREIFTKEELDAYCYELTPRIWLNPHRSWLGLGNYDVNVIMYAVQQRNSEAIWFDRRRDPVCLNLDAIFGFIMNIGATASFSDKSINNGIACYLQLPMMISCMRHWIALRRIEHNFYNLDSKLTQPRRIGDEIQFLEFLRHQLLPDKDHELFIVMLTTTPTPTMENGSREQLWLKPQYRDPPEQLPEED